MSGTFYAFSMVSFTVSLTPQWATIKMQDKTNLNSIMQSPITNRSTDIMIGP